MHVCAFLMVSPSRKCILNQKHTAYLGTCLLQHILSAVRHDPVCRSVSAPETTHILIQKLLNTLFQYADHTASKRSTGYTHAQILHMRDQLAWLGVGC